VNNGLSAMIKIDNNLRNDSCPLCEASLLHNLGNINYPSPVSYSTTAVSLLATPELWQCRICNSAFVQNAVPEIESIALYTQGKSEQRYGAVNSEQPKTKVVAETLGKLLKKDMRFLDVGCNTGELLDFAKNKGCKTFGVEYSKDSLNILRRKGHIAYSTMSEVDESFDIITAFDLIEHLYNLPQFLDICVDLLSPAGYLVLLTGDIGCFSARLTRANWWYVRYPEHIVFPSRKYFELHPKFQIQDWISTYADRFYEQPLLRAVKNIAQALLAGDYSGLPSIGPDHALILITRRNSQ
jgi:SAM-dependent methyltransferase